MAQLAQMERHSAGLMIDHVTDLIDEAARLRRQAVQRASSGDKKQASNLFDHSMSIASIALSFRYDLADAYADNNDADGLIAALDKWAATIRTVEPPAR